MTVADEHQKTLHLLRHAKSSWDDPRAFDHERPLAPRGERAATRMAEHLVRAEVSPVLVLCSSARRTRQTLETIKPAFDARTMVRIDDSLYGADADELLDRLRRISADVGSVMMIGHNPGLHDLALELSGDGDAAALRQLDTQFPTGALATIDLGIADWRDAGPGVGFLRAMVIPKQLG
jgi:phosphohistidine phosphatase